MGRLRAEEAAQKNFTYIRPEDMSQIENLHERAGRLIEKKDFRGAIDVYSEILLIEPDDDGAYTNMGQAYMVVGDLERAENAFKNALHINPDNEIAVICLTKIKDPDASPALSLPEQEQEPEPAPIPVSTVPEPQETAKPKPFRSLFAVKQTRVESEKISLPAAPQVRQTPIETKKIALPSPKPSLLPIRTAPAPVKIQTVKSANTMNFSKNTVKTELKPVAVPLKIETPPVITKQSAVPGAKDVKAVLPRPKPAKSPKSSSDIDFIIHSDLSFNQWTQIALKNAGLYNGPIDGRIDGETAKAVRVFQERSSLQITGMVGPSTWTKLKPYLDKDHSPKT